jgi:hypothetical protein
MPLAITNTTINEWVPNFDVASSIPSPPSFLTSAIDTSLWTTTPELRQWMINPKWEGLTIHNKYILRDIINTNKLRQLQGRTPKYKYPTWTKLLASDIVINSLHTITFIQEMLTKNELEIDETVPKPFSGSNKDFEKLTPCWQALCKIFDFPASHKSRAYDEAINSQKFQNVWARLNGEVVHINTLLPDDNIANIFEDNESDIISVEVKSLEPWIPDAGIYLTSVPVFLVCLAKKQWKKSYSSSNFYMDKLVDGPYPTLKEISEAKRVDFASIGGYIYAHNRIIGLKSDSRTIRLDSPEFLPEVLELFKDQGATCSKQSANYILINLSKAI